MALVGPCVIYALIPTDCPSPRNLYKSQSWETVDGRSSMQMDIEYCARQIVTDMGGHGRGAYGMVCCTANDDRNPSLQVTQGKTDDLLRYMAGVNPKAVCYGLTGREGNIQPKGDGRAANKYIR